MHINPEPPAGASSEAINILIVDDVAENLIAMEALLRRPQLNILCAASGAQALELLLKHDVALALLDVHMPEMDGFALAEFMRGSMRTRQVPIIFLTASPNDPLRAFKGYETGAVDFLHKPIEPLVILGKVNVFVELYEQRQLLTRRNAELERALDLNETMTAVLTHDLRTPLSVVLLCADKLRVELPDEPAIQRTLGFLDNSGQRMARMVEQLLDFSRIRTGGLRMDFSAKDLGKVAQASVEELRQAHGLRSIELQEEGDLLCDVDADRFAQILSNLIGNAIEHGGQEPIDISLDGRDPAHVRITISNAGMIPDQLLPRLFEPFKGRFHTSKGLGLGLYIADQFVRAHGGLLSARNHDGQVLMEALISRRNR
ncbi:His Kinase A (phospho-acceptor) domain-containing protein [Pseudoxanthomonas sp. GM95]|uniref:hybrid sensor histidine kinase/response regulator n=1 Tax=Pseudoxanthomonas sp. GM95 TaxID=1881043 RepID=UPI0008D5D791|nr:hybrid sensor histidine kinase/response regulator [Pseudoxanthomonas sp. GM95]SEL16592.1 His Kinase A (phospho-acceptor) domain-containing protein [Pseudoxanthomonas sp. GM95]